MHAMVARGLRIPESKKKVLKVNFTKYIKNKKASKPFEHPGAWQAYQGVTLFGIIGEHWKKA
jgi:hypothetical protein